MQIRKSLTKVAPVIFGLTLSITDGYSAEAAELVDPPTVFANQTLVILDQTTYNFFTPPCPLPHPNSFSPCIKSTLEMEEGEKSKTLPGNFQKTFP
jgi:hypothetical protein